MFLVVVELLLSLEVNRTVDKETYESLVDGLSFSVFLLLLDIFDKLTATS